MNQQQLINRVVSAAIWQLMRRAPTWLLIVIVGGAFLLAKAHGDEYPPGLFEHSPEINSDAPPTPAPTPLERPPAPLTPPLEQTPLAIAPTAPAPSLAPSQELPAPPMAEQDDPRSCFNLRRGIFATPEAAMVARSKCGYP
jgi:hypothetical protein